MQGDGGEWDSRPPGAMNRCLSPTRLIYFISMISAGNFSNFYKRNSYKYWLFTHRDVRSFVWRMTTPNIFTAGGRSCYKLRRHSHMFTHWHHSSSSSSSLFKDTSGFQGATDAHKYIYTFKKFRFWSKIFCLMWRLHISFIPFWFQARNSNENGEKKESGSWLSGFMSSSSKVTRVVFVLTDIGTS